MIALLVVYLCGSLAYAVVPSNNLKVDAQKPPTNIDKVIAYVNNSVITEHQVEHEIQQALKNFSSQGVNGQAVIPPPIADIKKRVIEELIMRKIQLDMAKRVGIVTTNDDVTLAIHNIAREHNMTVTAFKKLLNKQGINYADFRQQIKEQITLDRLKQGEVDSRVNVTDEEVNLVLSSEIYKQRVEYELADIIISVPSNATLFVAQQQSKLAESAYNELNSGVPFYKVAAKYSNSPNALKGGDLGWRSSSALPPNILSNIVVLPIGGYTRPIRLPVGFFIFKVNAIKKHGAPQIVKQYHVRHILIKVNSVTSNDEAKQKIIDIWSALMKDQHNPAKQNADFIKYAKAYSEDTSSINGGDIGWVSIGDTVPAFESAMLHTHVGVISAPIHSPFGWHILEVMAIRESNVASEKEKAEIRKELHDSKVAELYVQWLHEIREMAYVKMNIPKHK